MLLGGTPAFVAIATTTELRLSVERLGPTILNDPDMEKTDDKGGLGYVSAVDGGTGLRVELVLTTIHGKKEE